MRMPNALAILTIRAYQLTLAPVLRRLGLRCRHHPSCSQYGIMAYAQYGFFRATKLTWNRWHDCHPGSDRPFFDFP